MPQPKSSRSSSSRARKPAAKSAATKPAAKSAASKPAAKSAASKPAAKRATARKPAAKRSTASKPAGRRSTASKPATRAPASEEAVRANLTALRDTLRKGVLLTAEGVKSTLDDAVKRGRITRKDATELSQSLLSAGRSQADSLRSDL
ncbi:MAG TPA: hypothetical protein VF087_08310, partial [Solirubrobacteraceae bacterium]